MLPLIMNSYKPLPKKRWTKNTVFFSLVRTKESEKHWSTNSCLMTTIRGHNGPLPHVWEGLLGPIQVPKSASQKARTCLCPPSCRDRVKHVWGDRTAEDEGHVESASAQIGPSPSSVQSATFSREVWADNRSLI